MSSANDNGRELCHRCAGAHSPGTAARRGWCLLIAGQPGAWQGLAWSPQPGAPGSPVTVVDRRRHPDRVSALAGIRELVDSFDVARAAARLDLLMEGLAEQGQVASARAAGVRR